MIGLRRNKRTFYLCKKQLNSIAFGNPIKKFLNFEPISSDGEMITIGPDYSMYLKITCTPNEAKDFRNKDRCYIFNRPASTFDTSCNDADYVVDGDPVITLNEGKITLRKLSGE